MPKPPITPEPHLEGIAGALATLATELRSERETSARQIADLAGAIREQGVHIQSLAEAQREQWTHIGKQREGLQAVAVEAKASEREKEAGKNARDTLIQMVGLMAVCSAIVCGPIVNYVSGKNEALRGVLIEEIRKSDREISDLRAQLQATQAEIATDRAWRDRSQGLPELNFRQQERG